MGISVTTWSSSGGFKMTSKLCTRRSSLGIGLPVGFVVTLGCASAYSFVRRRTTCIVARVVRRTSGIFSAPSLWYHPRKRAAKRSPVPVKMSSSRGDVVFQTRLVPLSVKKKSWIYFMHIYYLNPYRLLYNVWKIISTWSNRSIRVQISPGAV